MCIADFELREVCTAVISDMAGSGCFEHTGHEFHIAADNRVAEACDALLHHRLIVRAGARAHAVDCTCTSGSAADTVGCGRGHRSRTHRHLTRNLGCTFKVPHVC